MKIIAFTAMLLFLSPLAAKGEGAEIRSRVRFEKGLSENAISGWEKEFFKISEDVPEAADEIADIEEIPDIDTVKKIKKVRHQKKRTVIRSQNKIENTSPQEIAGTQQDAVPQTVEKTEKKPVVDQHMTEMEVESLEEVPDNLADDVDRSERMRKMKELLKKRKGKGRIEDRRVY
ncbi:MAG TPA: hypothetical protein PLD55_09535 [bacterium]|jgi:hypothetical protein|nr:hypothetical protein [bacterium]HQB08245.1 hypothetical protein [bacterium]HQM84908.1 hypothetical protein [bacterium]